VTIWDPAVRVDVVIAATPLVTVTVPSVVEPSKNVIVPLAVVGTVAVKVTDWFTVEGLAEETSVTAGVTFDTTCVVVPVAELLFPSPP